jgi:hypothetical protein
LTLQTLVTINAVPEPSTFVTCGIGGFMSLAFARRQRRAQVAA